MVAGLEVELGDVAVGAECDEVVFAAGRNALDHDVLDLGERRIGDLFRGGHRVLGGLDLLAQRLRLGNQRRLLVFRRLGDALAVRVLRGTQLFECGDRGTAVTIGGERVIDAWSPTLRAPPASA